MRGATVVAAVLGVFASGGAARAHDETVSASTIEISDRTVIWKVDVGVAGLAKVAGLEALGAPGLGPPRLRALAADVGRYLAARAVVSAGPALTPEVGPLDPIAEEGAAIARVVQTLIYRAPAPLAELRVRVAFFEELTRAHRAILHVAWAGQQRTFVRTGPSDLLLARGALLPAARDVAWDFLRWGIDHIFRGYDHLAFLLCLILAAPAAGVRPLVKVVTAFTVAHSLTLLLGAFDAVRVSPRLAEVGIAASVVYLAAGNLMRARAPAPHRVPLVFGLGLLHGLGLATDLRDRLADAPRHLVLAVASFNLGVELGQLAIAAASFLLLAQLRRDARARGRPGLPARIDRIGSAMCLGLGLYWLVTRLAG